MPAQQDRCADREQELTDRQQKAEEFIQLLGSQDYAKAREILAPPLQAEWSSEKIQNLWENDLLATAGAFQSIVKTKAIDAINAQLIIVTTKFANSEEDLIVTLNPQQQIVGLDFPETRNIEEIAQEFVNALVAEDYPQARGYLHPLLKAEAFPEKVQQKWENLLKITGPYKQQVGYEVRKGSDGDGVDVVLVTLEFEKVSEDLFLVFDDQKQIVSVDFPDASD
ncbi:MAG: DUF3887 domain-containing protein [Hydrococcus sp. CSU_1_8]|nr:DUF3887 domain-containing protein [Hydrococcus sp. CSU_1_8]